MNRIGDIGLGLGISLIYLEYKTLDFYIIFPLINLFKDDYLFFFYNYSNISTLIVIFIMIGAIGKSAQLGLHT
jgi:NADH:ubiquinone oxidoreductase subunit 5 (subunit L)/multisubunit Na+/H+ antiporter MnhA subunit